MVRCWRKRGEESDPNAPQKESNGFEPCCSSSPVALKTVQDLVRSRSDLWRDGAVVLDAHYEHKSVLAQPGDVRATITILRKRRALANVLLCCNNRT